MITGMLVIPEKQEKHALFRFIDMYRLYTALIVYYLNWPTVISVITNLRVILLLLTDSNYVHGLSMSV